MAYAEPAPVRCAECGRVCGARVRRALCRGCYNAPDVRARHPQTGSLAGLQGQSTNERDTHRRVFPLPEPTTAYPGTPAKVAVLAERRRRGEALWHPHDPHLRDHEEQRASVERL